MRSWKDDVLIPAAFALSIGGGMVKKGKRQEKADGDVVENGV